MHTSSGDQVPMAQRDLPNNNLLLPLEIKSGESLKLYFKVQDYQFKNVQVRIISPGDFLSVITSYSIHYTKLYERYKQNNRTECSA